MSAFCLGTHFLLHVCRLQHSNLSDHLTPGWWCPNCRYLCLAGALEIRLKKESEAYASVVNENEVQAKSNRDFRSADLWPYLKVTEGKNYACYNT